MKRLFTLLLGLLFVVFTTTGVFAVDTYAKTTTKSTVVVEKGFFGKVFSPVKEKDGSKPKSQLIALLLAIFLGMYGIHRFYLGYTTIGIIQLALTILGFVTALFLVGYLILLGVWIWVLVDIIRILTGTLKPADGSDYDPAL